MGAWPMLEIRRECSPLRAKGLSLTQSDECVWRHHAHADCSAHRMRHGSTRVLMLCGLIVVNLHVRMHVAPGGSVLRIIRKRHTLQRHP